MGVGLSGIWKRWDGVALVVDDGNPNVFVLYQDGDMRWYPRWFVRVHFVRVD